MSYILEALKKSDQQRQQGAAPTLTSIQLPAGETPRRTFQWAAAMVATVFVTGLLVGWWQPWKLQPSPPTPAAAAERPVAPAPDTTPPVTAGAVARAPAREPPPPVAARTVAVAQREPEPAVAAPPATPTESNVMARAELPPAIQQELPAMVVSLHAYSGKPADRLVGINDKFLQEGDSLVPGLMLEEITRKDMIFRYKGFRFRQGVQ